MENPFDVLDDTSTQLDIHFIQKFKKLYTKEFAINKFGIKLKDINKMAKIAHNHYSLTDKRIDITHDIIDEFKKYAMQTTR